MRRTISLNSVNGTRLRRGAALGNVEFVMIQIEVREDSSQASNENYG
jgi:hypothetical protein